MAYLKRMGTGCFNLLQAGLLFNSQRAIDQELSRRNNQRFRDGLQWFTRDEAAVAEALANIIVPSDEETPGLEEVNVLGPSAIVALDKLASESSDRQLLYSRGLLSFDMWALARHGCIFTEMSRRDQIELLRAAQQIFESWTGTTSAVRKAWSRLRTLSGGGNGSFYAAQLYPQIRNDCFQVFYTSRVSWIWLEYDGPPMDDGYKSLVVPR